MTRILLIAALGGAFVVGCNKQPENKGVNISAPGVNVTVDKGVDVNAPGVNIKVNK